MVGGGLLPGLSVGGPHNGLITVSHILFTDDTFLFCDVNPSHVQTLQGILLCFEAIFGLKGKSK